MFRTKTKIGFGFLQYIETDDLGIEFVRILEPIKGNGDVSQAEVNGRKPWNMRFLFKTVTRKKGTEKVSFFGILSAYIDLGYALYVHKVRGELFA